MTHHISFPKLGNIAFDIDPVAFEFGPLSIRWYGIIICLGFVLAGLYAFKRCRSFDTTVDDIVDFLICLIPCAIIGARLYYVFSCWDYYGKHPEQIIKVWEGGLALYGGIILGVIAAIIFSKVKKIDFFNFGDMAVICIFIGQLIGRWGNFVNAEAFGAITNLPWGMSINGAAPCHPTFLYESLWNLAGFIFTHFYSRRRRFKGEIILIYFGWYGLGRAWIEGLRTDSLYLGSTDIRVSQLLAAVSFVVCASLLVYLHVSKRYKTISFLTLEKQACEAEICSCADASEETAETEETAEKAETETEKGETAEAETKQTEQ